MKKSPPWASIPGMPKRLKEHLRALENERAAEEAPYEWPCERCGVLFQPKRLPEPIARVRRREWQPFCAKCQISNLVNALFETPEERKEFAAMITGTRKQ